MWRASSSLNGRRHQFRVKRIFIFFVAEDLRVPSFLNPLDSTAILFSSIVADKNRVGSQWFELNFG